MVQNSSLDQVYYIVCMLFKIIVTTLEPQFNVTEICNHSTALETMLRPMALL